LPGWFEKEVSTKGDFDQQIDWLKSISIFQIDEVSFKFQAASTLSALSEIERVLSVLS
jgi:hypothetical protein